MTDDVTDRHLSPSDWVDAYAGPLYRLAYSRTGDRHVAEDLVQETLLAALQQREAFRGDGRQLGWLMGILRNKIADHFRRKGRRREVALGEEQEAEATSRFDGKGRWASPPLPWEAREEQLLENKEFWETVHGCLEKMPDRPRQVLALRVMQDESTETICDILGIKPNNVWVVLHRARSLLRSCLETNWFDQASAREGG